MTTQTETNPDAMWLTRIIWAVLVMVILGISGGLAWQIVHAPHAVPLKIHGTLPAFELTERSGKKFGSEDLKGHVWIADFVFTRCAGPCPVMSQKMMQIQEALRDAPSVRFVSFSVDPEYDTPKVLSEYADRFQANPEKWLFLTGKTETIRDIAMQHFKLALQTSPDPNAVLHSTHFVLVDGRNRIRGYYDSSEPASLGQIQDDARRLSKETP